MVAHNPTKNLPLNLTAKGGITPGEELPPKDVGTDPREHDKDRKETCVLFY
jgi:hypothetical protein